jgi:hypothetical protein
MVLEELSTYQAIQLGRKSNLDNNKKRHKKSMTNTEMSMQNKAKYNMLPQQCPQDPPSISPVRSSQAMVVDHLQPTASHLVHHAPAHPVQVMLISHANEEKNELN